MLPRQPLKDRLGSLVRRQGLGRPGSCEQHHADVWVSCG
jgi:hypothetical protein